MQTVTQQKKEEPRKLQEEIKKQEIVKTAGSLSHQSTVNGFASLKLAN